MVYPVPHILLASLLHNLFGSLQRHDEPSIPCTLHTVSLVSLTSKYPQFQSHALRMHDFCITHVCNPRLCNNPSHAYQSPYGLPCNPGTHDIMLFRAELQSSKRIAAMVMLALAGSPQGMDAASVSKVLQISGHKCPLGSGHHCCTLDPHRPGCCRLQEA